MAIDDNTSYELTGEQVKDLASKINAKADTADIPTVNDATLTITQNGTSAGTFTANASSNTTIALTDTTYSTMTGATSGTAGTSGLVPAPAAGDQGKFLQGDGTWDTPTDTTYTAGTNVQISAQNVISATDTTYSDMTGATSGTAGAAGLVPAPAAGDQDKVLSGAGTWVDQSGGGAFVGYFNAPSDTISAGTYTLYTDTSYTTDISGADVKTALADGKNVLLYFNDNKYIKVHSWKEIGTANVFMASFDKNGLAELTATIAKPSGWNLFGFVTTLKNINDATLTIQKNGTTVDTFSANASSNVTANITVPTQFSDLSGTVGSTQFADNTIASTRLANADCWVLLGSAKSTSAVTNNRVLNLAIPSGWRATSLRVNVMFELSSDSWVDLRAYNTSGNLIQHTANTVWSLTGTGGGTGEDGVAYICNAVNPGTNRCVAMEAESFRPSGTTFYRSWISKSGYGWGIRLTSALAKNSNDIGSIQLWTGGTAKSGAWIKVWGRKD